MTFGILSMIELKCFKYLCITLFMFTFDPKIVVIMAGLSCDCKVYVT